MSVSGNRQHRLAGLDLVDSDRSPRPAAAVVRPPPCPRPVRPAALGQAVACADHLRRHGRRHGMLGGDGSLH